MACALTFSLAMSSATNHCEVDAAMLKSTSVATSESMGFYHLPTDVIGNVMSQWISTPDLARLDTSTVNRRDRTIFLELIHQRHFVTNGLDQTSVTNDYFQWLVIRNIRIRSLNLTTRSSFSSNAFYSILQLQHFIKEIANLKADFTSSRLTECALGILKKCSRQVQSLTIANTELTDCELQGIINTADSQEGFTSLRSIDASVCKVSHNSLTRLLTHCPNLEEIRLAAADNVEDRTVERLVKLCPKLKKIVLDDCLRITDTSIMAIAQDCKYLASLEVRRCPNLTDSALSSLVKNTKDTLKILSLNGCIQITDSTLQDIADYALELERLDVSFCTKLTEEGVWMVIKYCPHLKSIALNFCHGITASHYKSWKSLFQHKCFIQCIHLADD